MAITNAVSSQAANTTTSVVTLPSSVAAGDLIIALIGADSGAGAMTWPSPWVEIKDDALVGVQFSAAYLIASGGETSVSVTHTTERSNHIAFCIPAAEWHGTTPPEINATATQGTSTQPNPPALAPSWGTEAGHWIAVAVADDSAPPGPITAYPASYTSNNVTSNTATSAAFLAAAIRESFSTASENPGVFTMTGSEDWGAYTIAVRPAGSTSAALAGIVAGQATLAGDLSAFPAAVLQGLITGQSTVAGDLTPGATSAVLQGVIGGISTLSADLTPAPAAQLAGIIAAQSGVSGTLFDPSSVILPTLSAIGNVFIEIWAPTPPVARWDSALWGTATWSAESWQDITPQSQNLRFGWGANDASQGILTQVAANAWTVYTYDPDRLLDPANDDSPYFSALRPGTHVQVRYDDGTNERILKEGTIDQIAYSLQGQRGQIRVVDRVSKMAGAVLPANLTGVPATLYAAARYLLVAAGLDNEIWTDPAPGTDPPVGGTMTSETSVWDWLNAIALDCAHGVYVVPWDITVPIGGKTGIRSVVKFVDFTATAVDNGLTFGGATGIPIEDIQPNASREGVFSQVTTFDDGAPTTPLTATDAESVTRFGVVPYKRDRPVPSGLFLNDAILQDRKGASLQYDLGTLRPVTTAQLLALFDAKMLEVARVVGDSRDNGDDLITNPIDIDTFLLGVSFEANTATGWSATAVSYITSLWWLTN